MSDVEATGYMPDERDLEFVDLDAYGVDPAAAAILPADLSRHHRVVAIKRKFGTPVIATADPDDLPALDSIRAVLGRDFITVVAPLDQIDRYIDLAYDEGAQARAASARDGVNGDEPGHGVDALDQALAEVTMAGTAPLPADMNIPSPVPGPGADGADGADGSDQGGGTVVSAHSGDELAALALSLEGEQPAVEPDQSGESTVDAVDAADLVAEAVATYRDLHPDEAVSQ